MIVSHKHKFIFVKTHKTATQTFLKFIKPHLGPDDVMAGDPEERDTSTGEIINTNTQINVDKKFETGLCASDYQETYGNHLPWFMIKTIVGDDIWNEYTKFTIERDPYDRMLSLFFFLNTPIFNNSILISPEYKNEVLAEQETNWNKYEKLPSDQHPIPLMVQWSKDNTIMTLYPEETRSYFEEWLLTQLESPTLPLTEDDTYGVSPHVENPMVEQELHNYKQTAEKFGFKKYSKLIDVDVVWTDPNNDMKFFHSPFVDDNKALLWEQYFTQGSHILGQCRFLNYGNYFDGKNLQVDHVVDFKNVGDNIGRLFDKSGIDIKCNKTIYDAATQNAHYRKNLKSKKPVDWWYSGPRGEWLHKVIKRRFYNDNMNENQINFNKIIQ